MKEKILIILELLLNQFFLDNEINEEKKKYYRWWAFIFQNKILHRLSKIVIYVTRLKEDHTFRDYFELSWFPADPAKIRRPITSFFIYDSNVDMYHLIIFFFILVRPDYKRGYEFSVSVPRWYKSLRKAESISMLMIKINFNK
jgi:hypothetical protein